MKRLNLTVIHLQCLFTLYDTVCDGRRIIIGNTELELPTEPTIVESTRTMHSNAILNMKET